MWYETLVRFARAGEPCALLTVVEAHGSTPRGVGSKMVVNHRGEIDGSIGGGVVEHVSLGEARKAIERNTCLTLRFSLQGDEWKVTDEISIQGLCGGNVTVLIEPILPSREIVIFGGGHVAGKLSRLCDVLDIPYRVYDDRPEFASAERFPNARARVCASYDQIRSRIELGSSSYCVIMTHGHVHDGTCLEALMSLPQLPYVGMIGSAHKVEALVAAARAKGVAIDDRLYSPIGLKLGGKLPEEIALSILAEVKLVMEKGQPVHCRRNWAGS